MNIIEENDSEYKSELKLWENTDNNIWLEVGYFDAEDPYSTHGIALTQSDAVALIKELTRLVGYVPTSQIKHEQPKINQASTEGKSRFINQPPTSDQPAQQLTIDGSPALPSRVNWGK